MFRFPLTKLLDEQACYDFLLDVLHPDGLHLGARVFELPHGAVLLLQIMSWGLKVIFFCWLQLMIRWTFPRFRPDQRHLAAGFAQTIDRVPDFHLLILLFDEHGDASLLEVHGVLLGKS